MKIVHVMSDGTIRDSIEGVVIPKEHPAYKLLKNLDLTGKNSSAEKQTNGDQKTA